MTYRLVVSPIHWVFPPAYSVVFVTARPFHSLLFLIPWFPPPSEQDPLLTGPFPSVSRTFVYPTRLQYPIKFTMTRAITLCHVFHIFLYLKSSFNRNLPILDKASSSISCACSFAYKIKYGIMVFFFTHSDSNSDSHSSVYNSNILESFHISLMPIMTPNS